MELESGRSQADKATLPSRVLTPRAQICARIGSDLMNYANERPDEFPLLNSSESSRVRAFVRANVLRWILPPLLLLLLLLLLIVSRSRAKAGV